MFGPAFYRNLVVVFTHWGFNDKDVRKRRGKTIEETTSQLWHSICEGTTQKLHKFFPETQDFVFLAHGSSYMATAASNAIPMVAIDALHDPEDTTEKEAFEAQMENLWKIVANFSRLPVMDVKMARDKRAILMAQLDAVERAHQEERARLADEVTLYKSIAENHEEGVS